MKIDWEIIQSDHLFNKHYFRLRLLHRISANFWEVRNLIWRGIRGH